MEWAYYLLKSVFILLGVITIIIGKYLSVKIIMPKQEKYRVIDEKNYIKSYRMQFYCLGFYYILLGIVLMFISGWTNIIGIFVIIPSLIIVACSPKRRKYIEKIAKM